MVLATCVLMPSSDLRASDWILSSISLHGLMGGCLGRAASASSASLLCLSAFTSSSTASCFRVSPIPRRSAFPPFCPFSLLCSSASLSSSSSPELSASPSLAVKYLTTYSITFSTWCTSSGLFPSFTLPVNTALFRSVSSARPPRIIAMTDILLSG